MHVYGKVMFGGLAAFAVLQLVRPSIPVKPATAEVQAPPEVRRVLEKDCYSCHSNQRRLSWFDEIVPGYWLVRHDVLTAREHLNFETLGSKPPAMQKATLYEAVNMVQLGAMPLPQFRRLHPEATVTAGELKTVKDYLAPWTPAPDRPGNTPGSSGHKTDAAPAAVPDAAAVPLAAAAIAHEFNGMPFDADFQNWKPLSTTDRGDNNTFRFILGNDSAVKAAQAGKISPWPDGARFAKIAWQQEAGTDGLVHPGKFVQVELMEKDARRYQDTEGWNWGRWRGLDLKPYGKDARFVNECTSCHLPVRGDDYVYTLPITRTRVSGREVVNNAAAALPVSLPYQPLSWSAITMYVDHRDHTTATLYGNDAAMSAVKPSRKGPGVSRTAYPNGAVLALVTWVQREDPHWFGGRIPDKPEYIEFVNVAASGQSGGYRRFAGNGLAGDAGSGSTAAQRADFILGLHPARLPDI